MELFKPLCIYKALQEDERTNWKSLKALMRYSWKAWQHFTFLGIRFLIFFAVKQGALIASISS